MAPVNQLPFHEPRPVFKADESHQSGPIGRLTVSVVSTHDREDFCLLRIRRNGQGPARLEASLPVRGPLLTPREVEVLHWVEQGMANADIALLCGVSVRTVHKHLQHIFEKLNVENRVAAVRKMRELSGDGLRGSGYPRNSPGPLGSRDVQPPQKRAVAADTDERIPLR